ncbi:TolC family protein [Acidithiobacillus sp. VAN18-1]|uniref:TolC family protein n=1 Tax=Igneacidithiobacillus copahuensis TaxID=2724909 RepID=A0AAE3CJY4_9PROT|nr:TolC family protein [Igneacidithiobacillus copahuensis]MBU2788194.1 TolC family protein [Igneacidithiobacillus copahuensis]MBU2797505.1 TolC family protein [Acidithiobacillus sp. VAN18-2]
MVFEVRNWKRYFLSSAIFLTLIARFADASTVLTLPQAISDALHTQPQVFQSAHAAAASRDLSRAAHAVLLPQISLAAGSIWSESRAGTPLFVAANGPREVIGRIQVSLPLYAPQLYALAKVAKDQSAVALSQEKEAQLTVVTRVVNAYFQLALLKTQMTIWRSTLDTAQRLYRFTHKAYTAGAVSELDLVQTALLRNNARTGLQQATAEARAAMRLLNLQIGRAPDGDVVLPHLPASDNPLPMPSMLDAEARRTQPLIQAADRQISVGHAQANVQRGAMLPTISADASYGVDTVTAPQGNDLGWQGAVTLNMPIFGFGAHRQRIAAAQEQVAVLRSARQALILQINSQIAHDYGSAQAAQKTLANARRAAHEAHLVYIMTSKGYFAGALNALNLAQAEGSWVRSRLRLSSAKVAVLMTRAQLDLDMGQYPEKP